MTLGNDQLLYTPAECRPRLRVGKTKLASLIRSGELRSVKIGRARRIPAAALEEYVAQLEQVATQPTSS